MNYLKSVKAAVMFALVLFSVVIAYGWDLQDKDRGRPSGEPPENNRYVCPQKKYVDCMPPVPKERQEECSKGHVDWINSHCPGVKVVY